MQNALRELRLLAPYFRDRPRLTGAHAEYFASQDYQAALDTIGNDAGAMAKLTIKLLEHMALNPRDGNRLSDFLRVGSDSETVFVCLHFNRTVNLVGFFVLPVTAPELPLLAAAIEKNLASKMFKAAVMHRRLENSNHRRFRRFESAARLAASKAREAAEVSVPAASQYASDESRFQRSRTISEMSNEAYNAAFDTAMNKLLARIGAVGRQAFDPSFRGNYMDMLIAFASSHICPVHSQEACCA